MNGAEFKGLDIESKVKYINDLLTKGESVDNIRMTLGIGKNYIANEFKKYNYKLDRNLNQYVSIESNTTNIVQPTTKQSKVVKVDNNTNTNDSNYKALEGQIKDLQKQINDINNRLDNNSITTVVTQATTSIVHSDIDSTKEAKNRSYRIYTDIHEEFKKFCDNNKQHKVQDIISSAIKEYLDKYNK